MAVHLSSPGADRLGLKLSATDHSSPSPLDDSDTENEEDTMNLYGPKQLADSMRTVRKNTILIAEDIPEKDYSYRPTPESRSVAETLVHIASLSRADRFLHEGRAPLVARGFRLRGAL